MKLTPHVVAETIMMMGPRHPTWRTAKALPGLLALIKQAVLFDFGTVHASPEHKDFAVDLYERKLFGLPFPVTAFAFEGTPHVNPAIPTQRIGGGMMILHMDEKRGLHAIMCTEQRDEHGRSIGGIPIGVVMGAKLSNPTGDSVDITEATYPVMSDDIMAMMYGSAGPEGHDLMRQRVCSNLVGCMGMTVMLMSHGVTTERRDAPDKLNKARERKGKPAIRESYVVRLSLGDTYRIATEAGEESIAGHVRGSVRMHWRRGHFRTIRRGTDNELVVPVAPALIGANENAEPIRKAYAVRTP